MAFFSDESVELSKLKRQLQANETQINTIQQRNNELSTQVTNLKSTQSELESTLNSTQLSLEESQSQSTSLRKQLVDKDLTLENLKRSLSERDGKEKAMVRDSGRNEKRRERDYELKQDESEKKVDELESVIKKLKVELRDNGITILGLENRLKVKEGGLSQTTRIEGDSHLISQETDGQTLELKEENSKLKAQNQELEKKLKTNAAIPTIPKHSNQSRFGFVPTTNPSQPTSNPSSMAANSRPRKPRSSSISIVEAPSQSTVQIQHLQSSLSESEKKVESLESQLELSRRSALKADNASLVEIKRLETSETELRTEIEEVKEEMMWKERELKEVRDELEEKEKELKEEKEGLARVLENARDDKKSEVEIDFLRSKLGEQDGLIESLTENLKKREAELRAGRRLLKELGGLISDNGGEKLEDRDEFEDSFSGVSISGDSLTPTKVNNFSTPSKSSTLKNGFNSSMRVNSQQFFTTPAKFKDQGFQPPKYERREFESDLMDGIEELRIELIDEKRRREFREIESKMMIKDEDSKDLLKEIESLKLGLSISETLRSKVGKVSEREKLKLEMKLCENSLEKKVLQEEFLLKLGDERKERLGERKELEERILELSEKVGKNGEAENERERNEEQRKEMENKYEEVMLEIKELQEKLQIKESELEESELQLEELRQNFEELESTSRHNSEAQSQDFKASLQEFNDLADKLRSEMKENGTSLQQCRERILRREEQIGTHQKEIKTLTSRNEELNNLLSKSKTNERLAGMDRESGEAELERIKNELEGNIEQERKEKERVESELENIRREIDVLQQEKSGREEKLEQEIVQSKEAKDVLETRNQELEGLVSEKESKISELEQSLKGISATSESNEEVLKSLREGSEGSEKELIERIQVLDSKLQENLQLIHGFEIEDQKKREEICRIQKELEESLKQLEAGKEENRVSEKTIEELKAQEQELSNLKSAVENELLELKDIQETNVSESQSLQVLSEEKSSRIQELETALAEVEAQVQPLKLQLEIRDKEAGEAQEKIKTLETEGKGLRTDYETLQNSQSQLQEAKFKLESEVSADGNRWETEKRQLEARVSALESENLEASERADIERKEVLESSQADLKALSEEVSAKAEIISRLEGEKQSLSAQLESLASSSNHTTAELSDAHGARIRELEDQLDSLKSELEVSTLPAQSSIEELQSKNQEIAITAGELDRQLAEKSGQVKELQEEVQQARESLEKVTRDHSILLENYSKLSAKSTDLESEVNDQVLSFQDQLNQASISGASLREQIQLRDSLVKELSEEIESARASIDSKDEKLREIDELYWDEKEEAARLQDIEEEFKNLLIESEESKHLVEVLKQQGEKDRRKIQEFDEVIESHKEAIEAKEKEIKRLTKRSREDEIEVRKHLSDIRAVESRLLESGNQLMELKNKYQESKVQQIQLQGALDMAKDRLKELEDERDNGNGFGGGNGADNVAMMELNEKILHLENQLQVANEEAENNDTESISQKKEIKKLMSRNKTLQAKVDQLKARLEDLPPSSVLPAVSSVVAANSPSSQQAPTPTLVREVTPEASTLPAVSNRDLSEAKSHTPLSFPTSSSSSTSTSSLSRKRSSPETDHQSELQSQLGNGGLPASGSSGSVSSSGKPSTRAVYQASPSRPVSSYTPISRSKSKDFGASLSASIKKRERIASDGLQLESKETEPSEFGSIFRNQISTDPVSSTEMFESKSRSRSPSKDIALKEKSNFNTSHAQQFSTHSSVTSKPHDSLSSTVSEMDIKKKDNVDAVKNFLARNKSAKKPSSFMTKALSQPRT